MNPIRRLKRLFARDTQGPAKLAALSERHIILQTQQISQRNRERAALGTLREVEFSAFSQWGEDGIIDWLVDRLPSLVPTFVEFGVGNYRESNTRLLLLARNWRGAVIDGSMDYVNDIGSQDIYWRHDLDAQCAFIDRDNINGLIENAGISGEIGLLSVDVDGNDYWIWEAISTVRPAIVVCEYNAVFGDVAAVSVPYAADFVRSRAHYSHLYFGASLRAFVHLAKSKGYSFVGTVSSGCNAFFVRDDLASSVLAAVERVAAFPSAVRESRNEAGQLSFTRGAARTKLIEHLPLIEVTSGRTTTLAELPAVYSVDWAAGRWTEL